jgi:hypothetical protein
VWYCKYITKTKGKLMATKTQAEKLLTKHNVTLGEILKQELEGYSGILDAPEGYYLNSTGLHIAGVFGWNMPEFWNAVVSDLADGLSSCSGGGCESCIEVAA